MNYIAVELNPLRGFSPAESIAAAISKVKCIAPTRSVLILALILTGLQLADGIMTGFGMEIYGTAAEANTLLRALMNSIGIWPALILTKLAAIIIIFGLCQLSERVKWIPLAMKSVIAVYVILAIIPWGFILMDNYGII